MTGKRPGALINAVVAIFLQAVFNAFAGVLLLWAAAEDVEHGREPGSLIYVLAYVSIVIAVVLAVFGVLLVRRVEWARIPVTVIEIVGIVSGLLTLVQGAPAGIANIALATLVLVSMFRADTTQWLRPTPF